MNAVYLTYPLGYYLYSKEDQHSLSNWLFSDVPPEHRVRVLSPNGSVIDQIRATALDNEALVLELIQQSSPPSSIFPKSTLLIVVVFDTSVTTQLSIQNAYQHPHAYLNERLATYISTCNCDLVLMHIGIDQQTDNDKELYETIVADFQTYADKFDIAVRYYYKSIWATHKVTGLFDELGYGETTSLARSSDHLNIEWPLTARINLQHVGLGSHKVYNFVLRLGSLYTASADSKARLWLYAKKPNWTTSDDLYFNGICLWTPHAESVDFRAPASRNEPWKAIHMSIEVGGMVLDSICALLEPIELRQYQDGMNFDEKLSFDINPGEDMYSIKRKLDESIRNILNQL